MGLRQAETFLRERPDQDRCTDERERASLRPTTLEAATRADLEAFMADVLARRAPQHGGHLLQGPQSGHKLQVVDRLTKATMA
jgi:hypothetical protein